MTPIQEAYALLQQQPESNIRIIVELLQRMSQPNPQVALPFRRTGLARGRVNFPEDFDEHFDELNQEIANAFYGDTL